MNPTAAALALSAAERRLQAQRAVPRSFRDREIVGHRCWRVIADARPRWIGHVYANPHIMLLSMVHDVFWYAGEPMTGDPLEDPEAGVYAWNDPAYAVSYAAAALAGPVGAHFESGIAVGTVLLYGSVVRCERGYRASHAMIADIGDVLSLSGTLATADRLPVRPGAPTETTVVTVGHPAATNATLLGWIREEYKLPYRGPDLTDSLS